MLGGGGGICKLSLLILLFDFDQTFPFPRPITSIFESQQDAGLCEINSLHRVLPKLTLRRMVCRKFALCRMVCPRFAPTLAKCYSGLSGRLQGDDVRASSREKRMQRCRRISGRHRVHWGRGKNLKTYSAEVTKVACTVLQPRKRMLKNTFQSNPLKMISEYLTCVKGNEAVWRRGYTLTCDCWIDLLHFVCFFFISFLLLQLHTLSKL